MNTLQTPSNLRHQKGATMITTLVFLLLMTIVTVSASKMSILEMLVSSNNQRQMEMFQQTANDLKELTTPVKFFDAYYANEHQIPWTHNLDANPLKPSTKESIASRDFKYICGGFNGLAVSIGPSESPCYLYDFGVKTSLSNSGVRDKHFRGAGKEFPDGTRNSTLD